MKRKNPNDATLRNIRALKKRVLRLEKNFSHYMGRYAVLLEKLDIHLKSKKK